MKHTLPQQKGQPVHNIVTTVIQNVKCFQIIYILNKNYIINLVYFACPVIFIELDAYKFSSRPWSTEPHIQ